MLDSWTDADSLSLSGRNRCRHALHRRRRQHRRGRRYGGNLRKKIYHRLGSVRACYHESWSRAIFASPVGIGIGIGIVQGLSWMSPHEMETRMLIFRQRYFVKSCSRTVRRAVMPLVAVAFVIAQTGCESVPIRAFRGARHYVAGTQALDQNDGALAIAELERAAALVPLASEIQNHLGLAYWSNGRSDEARFAFEKAVALDCGNVVARTNLEQLMGSVNVATEESVGRVRGVNENGE